MIFGRKCDQQTVYLADLCWFKLFDHHLFLSHQPSCRCDFHSSSSFGPACCHTFQRSSVVRHDIDVRHGFTAAKLCWEVLGSLVRKQDTVRHSHSYKLVQWLHAKRLGIKQLVRKVSSTNNKNGISSEHLWNSSSCAANVTSSCGPFPWPHALKIRATWRGTCDACVPPIFRIMKAGSSSAIAELHKN